MSPVAEDIVRRLENRRMDTAIRVQWAEGGGTLVFSSRELIINETPQQRLDLVNARLKSLWRQVTEGK